MRSTENRGRRTPVMETKSTFLARNAPASSTLLKAAAAATSRRRSSLANARPLRQYHLSKPVIGWMSARLMHGRLRDMTRDQMIAHLLAADAVARGVAAHGHHPFGAVLV